MTYRVSLAAFDFEQDEEIKNPIDAVKALVRLLGDCRLSDFNNMLYEVNNLDTDEQETIDLYTYHEGE